MCSNDRGGMGGLIVKIGDFWSQASKPHWRMSQHVIPSLVLRFTYIYTETLVSHKRLQYLFELSVTSPPPTELLLKVPFATIALTPPFHYMSGSHNKEQMWISWSGKTLTLKVAGFK